MASNSLTLFQIGDAVPNIFVQDWHGYDTSAKLQMKSTLGGREIIWGSSSRLAEPGKITISGIITDWYSGSVQTQVRHLESLIGEPTDIFAYEIISPGLERQRYSDILWLHTRGAIDGVKHDSKGGEETLSVSLVISPVWQSVNRFIWQFQTTKPNPFTVITTPSSEADFMSAIKPYPDFSDIDMHNNRSGLWTKRLYDDPLVVYNTTLWSLLHSRHRPEYPVTGYGVDVRSYVPRHQVVSSRWQWSAEPSSMYAITNMPDSGSIVITVDRQVGSDMWEYDSSLTTISLTALDASLAALGYTGIDPADILIIGDVERKPGFVLRNGVVLNCYPEITYSARYPGELGVERNYISITKPAGVLFGELHTFQRL